MISCKAEQTHEMNSVCKRLLETNKALDVVLIIDDYSKIIAKSFREEQNSSIRRMSLEEIAKTANRLNIAKGAFNVDKEISGKISNLHVRYNAMDIILYPLENDQTLVLVGVFDSSAIPAIYNSVLNELPTKTRSAIVVDDEPDIRNAIQEVLAKRGFSVSICGSGEECLSVLREQVANGKEFGIVVLDIRMTGMNGFETFKEIEKISPNTNVLFVTAFEYSQSDVSKMVNSNKVRVLKKPFSRGDLLQQINDRIYSQKS